MNHYISVFHASDDISNGIKDVGDDPLFTNEFTTWGICRPQVRVKWTNVGSQIVFVGYHKSSGEYYLKGIIKVGEKINLIEALKRYPTNKNIIVSKSEFKEENNSWRDKEKKNLIEEKYGNQIPVFLKQIKYQEELFQQNKSDDHEVDNWKCQRIFLCNFKQFCKCVDNGSCEKDSLFDKQKGYIVASESQDFSRFLIKWKEVCPKKFCLLSLKTPKGQHNVKKITQEEIMELIENIERKITEKE